MPSSRSLPSRLPVPALVLAAAALVLTACGSSAPAAKSTTSDATHTKAGPAGSTSTAQLGGSSGDFTSLNMSVRLVNLYVPRGSAQGQAIDVWSGQGEPSSSKKLATVPYGQVSQFFAPVVYGSADGANTSYSLTFFPAGQTPTNDGLLGNQSETSAPGQKLTMVIEPGDGTGIGGLTSVNLDELGSNASASGFTAPPKPAAGKALLTVDAGGLANSDKDGFELATASKTCAPYLDPETGKLTQTSDETTLVGGSERLDYEVDPGTSVGAVQVKSDQDALSACKNAPVPAAFDPKLSAGGRAYAFIYGSGISTAKVLVVPVS